MFDFSISQRRNEINRTFNLHIPTLFVIPTCVYLNIIMTSAWQWHLWHCYDNIIIIGYDNKFADPPVSWIQFPHGWFYKQLWSLQMCWRFSNNPTKKKTYELPSSALYVYAQDVYPFCPKYLYMKFESILN